MATFLALCQDVRRECRLASSGTPTTVAGQVGQLDRIVNWVADEWVRLQNEHPNWRWMRSEFSLQTQASDDTYAYNDAGMTDSIYGGAITRFARWWPHSFQIYLTSAGLSTRHYLPYDEWAYWRRVWLTGNILPSYPARASIDPRNNLRLGPKPDNIYTVTGEYQRSAQTLVNDTDVPEMPERYHQLIVARAMKRFANSQAAPEIMANAIEIEEKLEPTLFADQIAAPEFGPPLT